MNRPNFITTRTRKDPLLFRYMCINMNNTVCGTLFPTKKGIATLGYYVGTLFTPQKVIVAIPFFVGKSVPHTTVL